MGCDIHIYTEVKHKLMNGKEFWFCCDNFEPNYLYGYDEYESEWLHKPIYDERSYLLFAALADVRNDGFIQPFAPPRGIPSDASKIVVDAVNEWDIDGHSHSWMTASELFRYQSQHPTTKYIGMISKEDREKLDKLGIVPRTWCGWTNVSGYERRTWEVPGSPVDELVKCVKEKMAEQFLIFSWENNIEQEDKLLRHADDFRIIFWFDN